MSPGISSWLNGGTSSLNHYGLDAKSYHVQPLGGRAQETQHIHKECRAANRDHHYRNTRR
jgi:hypothetical protein